MNNLKIKIGYVTIEQGANEPSLIFCDEIEYQHDVEELIDGNIIFDHHLLFWKKCGKRKELVFKIYLPNLKKEDEFKDIREALKFVGVRLIC